MGRDDDDEASGEDPATIDPMGSDGPGFPLNSQYTIPGNQNEPAFTTSRGGTFLRSFGNDTIEPRDARVVRRNKEDIGRGARFKEAGRFCRYVCTCVHIYVCVCVCVYTYENAHVRAIVEISPRLSVSDDDIRRL